MKISSIYFIWMFSVEFFDLFQFAVKFLELVGSRQCGHFFFSQTIFIFIELFETYRAL